MKRKQTTRKSKLSSLETMDYFLVRYNL